MKKRYIFLFVVVIIGISVAGLVVVLDPPFREPEPVRILLGGDVYPGNRIEERLQNKGVEDFTANILPVRQEVDLHFANLETPVTNRNTTTVKKTFLFKSQPQIALPILKSLGVDGVSIANNHIMDYGPEGLRETKQHLDSVNIGYTGAGKNREKAEKPVFFEANNQTVALLAFSNTFPRSFWAGEDKPGTAFGAAGRVRDAVKETSEKADFTLVSFHWGAELDTTPQKYQKNLARSSIDAGADVVFGHHPHVIQPVEKYNGGVIYYSLGNYLFTTLTDNIRYGLLAEVTLEPGTKPSTRYHLLNVNNYEVNYSPYVVQKFDAGNKLVRYLDKNYGLRLVIKD